jgi:hypothetical protein
MPLTLRNLQLIEGCSKNGDSTSNVGHIHLLIKWEYIQPRPQAFWFLSSVCKLSVSGLSALRGMANGEGHTSSTLNSIASKKKLMCVNVWCNKTPPNLQFLLQENINNNTARNGKSSSKNIICRMIEFSLKSSCLHPVFGTLFSTLSPLWVRSTKLRKSY